MSNYKVEGRICKPKATQKAPKSWLRKGVNLNYAENGHQFKESLAEGADKVNLGHATEIQYSHSKACRHTVLRPTVGED